MPPSQDMPLIMVNAFVFPFSRWWSVDSTSRTWSASDWPWTRNLLIFPKASGVSGEGLLSRGNSALLVVGTLGTLLKICFFDSRRSDD